MKIMAFPVWYKISRPKKNVVSLAKIPLSGVSNLINLAQTSLCGTFIHKS